MALEDLNLDDRTFEEIVEEVKARIPRYAPEWTNLNESDPGVTLVQLYAWMTEMMLYRFNRVPQKNHLAFLRLLGIQTRPARPARADLTFTPARFDFSESIVPRRVPVAAAGGAADEPLVFETDEALIMLGAELDRMLTFDGRFYRSVLEESANVGQAFRPFGDPVRPDRALILGLRSDVPLTSHSIALAVYVADDERPIQTCDEELANMPVPASLQWSSWDGTRWNDFSVDVDDTRAFTRSGYVRFRIDPRRIQSATIPGDPEPRNWIRCRVATGAYDRPPHIDSVLINTVTATNATTSVDEIVGTSDGSLEQRFTLFEAPVVVHERPVRRGEVDVQSVELEVAGKTWQEVADFSASGPGDEHFVLDPTTGMITFGDGDRGLVPVLGAQIVARSYRSGGGRMGNVGAQVITDVQTVVDYLDAVTNRRPAYGGADEETTEQAKRRAPGALKSKDRAVTAEDFEHLATMTPGVQIARAKAIPRHHPSFPTQRTPGAVTLVVVPQAPGPRPMPTSATLRAVCRYLDRRRLVTTELFVRAPRYRDVRVEVDVVVRRDADLASVRAAVEARLFEHFHPLEAGGWPFGRTIYFSEVYRVVLDADAGLERIEQDGLRIFLDDREQPLCRDVPIEADALVTSQRHVVRSRYREAFE
ncbi:MAG: putative baseplate assembly protein [Deltaproteobacteria bacterium]